ncbi:MAG TPA: cytochrome b/b6 domain-containing protein [Methylomirabilota bacterium]|nr:cytochrome b/b6 domain-containing protein [Methylomirabilota bacterium]
MTRTPASGTERSLHWLVAGPALALLATGMVLYAPALSEAIGLRFWVRTLHLVAAVALAGAPLAVLAVRPRAVLGAERELMVWSGADRDWFLHPWRLLLDRSGRRPPPARFNGGQRLFAALAAGGLLVLLLTGVPMYWWGWFSAGLVARARDVHVLASFGLAALILGHVYLAVFAPVEER